MTSLPGSGGAPRRRLVALAGFMGSGKTTIGSLLARQLGWRFADLDTLIERAAGHAITEIFERHGEAAFREVEREQLLAALGRAAEFAQPTVLALGGGTIAQTGNLELLRAAGAAVVWLDCPLERLIARCALVTTRPLFRDEASFRALTNSACRIISRPTIAWRPWGTRGPSSSAFSRWRFSRRIGARTR